MPQAPSAAAFWDNIKGGRYSVTDVPPERWDPALYFDPDHSARDKTYSKIGGWVREFDWNPIQWRLPIPPTVAAQMDEGQRWAVSAARAALIDAGWPNWSVDSDNVAVILGNALGGEKHYSSSMRIRLPEVLSRLESSPTLKGLPADVQRAIVEETRAGYLDNTFEITEDTMPGELANVIAGRVCNLLNLRGPNFTTDAACASGLAALNAAIDGLVDHQYDAVVTGGVDRNMGIDAFVKFCKIGALSATGTRPFDAGADGFVMGEGAALVVLKRLEDAERDGDRVYAVILGVGGSSDGKGKGITAPNPVGQQLAVRRAWLRAGADPGTAMAVEAHGTSTRVGDAAELSSLTTVFGESTSAVGSIALGSVKSNIGHLKAAAGTAGLFKMTMSLHEKVLAPSLNFVNPNENVDWGATPFAVNTGLRAWPESPYGARRGAVSAFGFGGTNFHVVLEEHVPGRYRPKARVFAAAEVPATSVSSAVVSTPGPAVPAGPASPAVPASPNVPAGPAAPVAPAAPRKVPLRGAYVIGGRSDGEIVDQLTAALAAAKAGTAPAPTAPDPAIGAALIRVAVDYADAAELAAKVDKLLKAFASGNAAAFRLLRQQGVYVGRGPAPKVAFLYTGQGSQYVNMLKGLAAREPIVAQTFAEADRVMTPLLGRPLTSFIFIDSSDEAAVKTLNKQLMQTEITQPAVLATDLALTRLFAAYGIAPDMVMGHSLGEYGALVAAHSLTLPSALEAVSARGREMTKVSMADNGAMAAVFGPLEEIRRIVAEADGYVVVANINSFSQAVVGGATDAVERIIERFAAAGINATRIPVSHAFHTQIVAPASVPFVDALRRLDLKPPTLPIVANVTGEFYPADATTETMLDYTGRQIASPVQFVAGLETLYAAGARVFVEVGPKKALHGFVEDVLGSQHDDVVALYTNHPKVADEVAVNQALCGLYAAGLGFTDAAPSPAAAPAAVSTVPVAAPLATTSPAPTPVPAAPAAIRPASQGSAVSDQTIAELGKLFASVLDEGLRLYAADLGYSAGAAALAGLPAPVAPAAVPGATEPVVVTGAALGLPGVDRVFDDANIARILAGQNFISVLSPQLRQMMVDKRVTRIVKDASGSGSFQTIDNAADVIKLAGVHAPLDVVAEFGIDKARDEALDITTRLALGAGFDAMRDAGIPLVMRYKTTTLGTQLPDKWLLPEALRDDTGVIFASAFPGYDRFADEIEKYVVFRGQRDNLLALEGVRALMAADDPARAEVDRLIAELRAAMEKEPYAFDRRFLFRVLSMGHSQFAEIIGARGPNTQVNSACASTTQAISLAEDWIRAGRCARVIVVSADDASGEHLLPWVTTGFLATGAAATDERVEDAATPFDRRRHGMIVGTGAAALVVESSVSARERGLAPIAEVLATITANSAFHGTRLDVEHIGGVMESLVAEAEARGYDRHLIAPATMFVSHETYTPARGGSAAAEINALRRVFGPDADKVVITNTKGFTGHAMGAGIEDVVAIKALETGIVPPVPNYKEPDPDLGNLTLSRGGSYPVEYALRLAAGFGSQVSMSLTRRIPAPDGRRRGPQELGYAYRVADNAAWQRWLDTLSGHSGSTLEVDHRRLRVVDLGAPKTPVALTTHVPVPYAAALRAAAGSPAAGTANASATTPFASSVAAPPSPVAQPAAAGAPTSVAPLTPSAPVPPSALAAPAAPATPPEPAAPAGDPILDRVTGIVAEMTGYPADLLDPDLDLEADLGVDTVKQAEVFAAVRSAWELERDENLKLRDFPTLRHVAGWVRGKLGLPEAGVAASGSALSTGGTVDVAAGAAMVSTGGLVGTHAVTDEILDRVTGIVAEMTGYPADLLDPDLDLEADLGVDTVKQAEVFAAVRSSWDLERDEDLKLRDFPTLRHVAGWVRGKLGLQEPSADAPAAVAPASGPSPVAAPPIATPAGAADDQILAKVTEIVADMTGYPADLLDPDLDLEADLGVDTVKQAEVFAAVRGAWDLERDENLKLRDFPTMNHVAGWVRTKLGLPEAGSAGTTPVTSAARPAAPETPSAATTAPIGDEVLAKVTEIVADITGYPADLLDPDLDLEADLGVDTVKQAEVFAAVRGAWDLERDENLKLRDFPTMNHVAGWVRGKLGIPEPSAAAAKSPAPAATGAAEGAAPDATGRGPREVSERGTSGELRGVTDSVLAKVTQIVADMTGYPADLLDPYLDLEADLGVDTVKQAEVFAAVRGAWDLERDENLKLRDFPTMNHVAGWVRERLGGAAPGATAAAAPAAAASPVAVHPHGQTISGDLRAIDALPRRIPVPSLRPALDNCVDTGVVLDGARVIVRGDGAGVADALVKRLEKAGATVLFGPAEVSDNEFAGRLAEWQEEGPIAGVYWLPALDDEGDVTAYGLGEWQGALQRRVKGLYATMRALWDASPFLVTATRLGGYHGYDAAGAASVLGGAVTGFTKSYKKERPDALVKAVDIPPSRKTAAIAEQLIEETLRDPGCVEVGRVEGQRFGVAFVEQPFPALHDDGSPLHDGGMPLTSDSVFVVTGAAGSIVSAITADLAQASGGTFHLLDLTPTPDPEDADLATFRADRNALKATIATRLKEAGQKATPVAIDREIARLERLEAALTAIETVQDAGGTAHYYSVDLTDPDAVAVVMEEVRERSGKIDVLLHAAGLEISRNLPEKEPREYNLVFDVKTTGWFNIWHAAKDLEVGAVVVFSSVAGRFGNQGQTDYSAANDLLCKVVSNLRRTRPQTRGLATDWTAWGGIGMATRGSIPKIMEMAGVQMLPPEAGVAWVRRELESSTFSGEVIVAGVLGAMAAEYHPTGGLATDRLGACGPMVGEVAASVHTGITSTTTLDPAQQAFLNDHRIDGTPVLPGVMGMESFAEVASLVTPQGYRVAGVEDVSFAAPVKFFRDEPRTLTISAVVSPTPEGGDLLARCTLTASRQLPGQAAPTISTHFTGTVRLTQADPEPGQAEVTTEATAGGALDQGLVYTFYFHGPAYQVVDEAWRDGDGATARMSAHLPDNHAPADAPLITAPRLVELSFQTAGLWEAGTAGRLALPMRVGRTSVLRDPSTVDGPLYARATPRAGGFDVLVTDATGSVVVRLDGYQTVQLPGDLSEDVAAALSRVFA
ncbi:hypothetical protein GCM10009810_05700 [Nostocoides vanveenii]|uniref:Polyketide synthase n=2 Tax=Nostocoides vanveenii TaxID=330835 RepID=A0ABN2K4A8_9MICO